MSGGTEAEVSGSISKCTPHRAFSCSFEDGFLKKSLLALIAPMFFPLLASPCLFSPLLSSPFPEITGLYSPFCASLLISLTVFPDARGAIEIYLIWLLNILWHAAREEISHDPSHVALCMCLFCLGQIYGKVVLFRLFSNVYYMSTSVNEC